MISKILTFFEKESINIGKTNILVAVSGGVDSVVLCYILNELEVTFGIAHCNFNLREQASDDAIFVEELAKYFNVPFYKKEFDTKKLLENSKESTQSLARKIRYEWFNELLEEHTYNFLATAHHLNDVVETMLFNQARGTGVRGMRGILSKNGKIIRPFLACTKAEILNLATENDIHYAEDLSNESDDYQRNFIRHHVVPLFEKINPSFLSTQANNRAHLLDLEEILKERVEQIKSNHCQSINGIYSVDYQSIKTEKGINTILFELLYSFGYNQDQVQQIQATFPTNGKLFYSDTHELLIHQSQLLIRLKDTEKLPTIHIKESDEVVEIGDQKIVVETITESPSVLDKEANIAYFDAEKLTFPLTLRTWKSGDAFKPFGMDGKKKKVQDFYSNEKMSLFEKEQTYLLESGQQIIWVVGKRTDDTTKITDSTTSILKISLL